MYSKEHEDQRHREIKAIASEIASQDITKWLRTDLGSVFEFKEAEGLFKKVHLFFSALSTADLSPLPVHALDAVLHRIQNVPKVLESIRDFRVSIGDPHRVKKELIERLEAEYNELYSECSRHIAFAKALLALQPVIEELKAEDRRRQAEFQKKLDEYDSAFEKLKTTANSSVNEVAKALEVVRQAAAETGVSQEATHFKTEADQQEKYANRWLGASIALFLAGVGYLVAIWYSWKEVPREASAGYVLHGALPRILILTVIFAALKWAAKNYGACRHNFTVNRHRQNALSSFQSFAKGAHDEQTKDAVLRQATSCVFAPQPSGYLKEEGSTPEPNQIIEIVRGTTGEKGK